MSYSLYDAAILHSKDALNSLSSILKKAESHANAASFTTAKLAEDMLDLSFQVHFTTDTAQKIAARLTGSEPLTLAREDCNSFESYQARIAQVLEVLNKVDRELVEKRIDEVVTIGLGPGKSADMKCRDFAQGYAIPNVFFHLTTAYAILRKEGVDLGKMDFLTPFVGQVAANQGLCHPSPPLYQLHALKLQSSNPTSASSPPLKWPRTGGYSVQSSPSRTTSSHPYEYPTFPNASIANNAQILRRPGFHRAVGRIHKTINEKQYGRNPHEPLAPGEATGIFPPFRGD
ncbi:hypothetical protein FAVG1_06768 [Fusarium avenaceum]|nr:hypothetical protein FAVG1_06768 [Fusarium avenaceum]